jgi:hypothetical protein
VGSVDGMKKLGDAGKEAAMVRLGSSLGSVWLALLDRCLFRFNSWWDNGHQSLDPKKVLSIKLWRRPLCGGAWVRRIRRVSTTQISYCILAGGRTTVHIQMLVLRCAFSARSLVEGTCFLPSEIRIGHHASGMGEV